MDSLFVIKGINPATGRVVAITLLAPTAIDAKKQAENAGLLRVTVGQDVENQVRHEGSDSSDRTPRILVVDDLEETRGLLMRMLRDEGYIATGASDGVEALEAMARSKPALVIMDLNMPRMNGLQAIQEIRKCGELREIPVIMFSASGKAARDEAMRAGANAFIFKDSMDWPKLQSEVLRLAGPGLGQKRIPDVRETENRSAC